MTECLFCRIVHREMPASVVYEDDAVVAFLDINPISPGHTLVLPKKHSTNISDISAEDLTAVVKSIPHIAKGVLKAVHATAYNIGSNTGADSGQAIFHTHFHIIPRKADDGLKFWEHGSYRDDAERERIAHSIAENIKS